MTASNPNLPNGHPYFGPQHSLDGYGPYGTQMMGPPVGTGYLPSPPTGSHQMHYFSSPMQASHMASALGYPSPSDLSPLTRSTSMTSPYLTSSYATPPSVQSLQRLPSFSAASVSDTPFSDLMTTSSSTPPQPYRQGSQGPMIPASPQVHTYHTAPRYEHSPAAPVISSSAASASAGAGSTAGQPAPPNTHNAGTSSARFSTPVTKRPIPPPPKSRRVAVLPGMQAPDSSSSLTLSALAAAAALAGPSAVKSEGRSHQPMLISPSKTYSVSPGPAGSDESADDGPSRSGAVEYRADGTVKKKRGRKRKYVSHTICVV